MGRLVVLLVAALLLTLWITSIAHNQPTVGSDEQTMRRQLTVVAGPTGTPAPTPRPSRTPRAR